jgi:hypothetical protein
MGSEARRSKVFSWQRSAHARDLVLKMKRDYFRELIKSDHQTLPRPYTTVRIMYIMLNECRFNGVATCLSISVPGSKSPKADELILRNGEFIPHF